MIYLDNNTEVQTIYIPRNDGKGIIHHGGDYNDGFEDGKMYQKSLLSSTAITENGHYVKNDGYSAVTVNVSQRPFARMKKVEDYLYYTEYDELDYTNAYDYFSSRIPSNAIGGCSAFRYGDEIGRNLDWLYDNEVTFVTKTPHTDQFKSTIGIAGSVASLTKSVVESGEIVEDYKILPFYIQDIINEDGLFVEMNVVPSTGFKRTVPTVEKRDTVCYIMLGRYIADRFSTVNDAIDYLQKYVEVCQSQTLEDMGYEVHFLLADENTTKVIEFIEDEIKVINIPVSTNFHIYGVDLLEDNTVYTPEDAIEGNYPTSLGIEKYGSGLERWNMIVTASTSYTVRELLNSLYYSNAYTNVNDVWYSEFVGGSITVDTPSNNPNFQSRISEYRQKFIEKDRNRPDVWITTHSCVYNIEDKSFTITSQEGSSEHEFSLDERILPSLQDKYVSINQTSTMVYPDSGYDGMSSVEVNTTEFEERIFNKGYSDGYTEGYSDGVEESGNEFKQKLIVIHDSNGNWHKAENGDIPYGVNIGCGSTFYFTCNFRIDENDIFYMTDSDVDLEFYVYANNDGYLIIDIDFGYDSAIGRRDNQREIIDENFVQWEHKWFRITKITNGAKVEMIQNPLYGYGRISDVDEEKGNAKLPIVTDGKIWKWTNDNGYVAVN